MPQIRRKIATSILTPCTVFFPSNYLAFYQLYLHILKTKMLQEGSHKFMFKLEPG